MELLATLNALPTITTAELVTANSKGGKMATPYILATVATGGAIKVFPNAEDGGGIGLQLVTNGKNGRIPAMWEGMADALLDIVGTGLVAPKPETSAERQRRNPVTVGSGPIEPAPSGPIEPAPTTVTLGNTYPIGHVLLDENPNYCWQVVADPADPTATHSRLAEQRDAC